MSVIICLDALKQLPPCFHSETEVTVQSQSVAIPIAMITVNSEGSPVLSFYVQLNTTTFVSRSVISMAVQVRSNEKKNRLNCVKGGACTLK